MDLYLYSTFLVLMTTQSSLQYSFTFTQSHTHSYSASISSTLLFYEAQFRVLHLAQGHFGMQTFFFGRLGLKLLTFRLEDNHSTPSATAITQAHSHHDPLPNLFPLSLLTPPLYHKDKHHINKFIIYVLASQTSFINLFNSKLHTPKPWCHYNHSACFTFIVH